jgi:hypothetical protein
MNTRFRCVTPAQSIATLPASCTSWPEPAPFPEPGEAYCGLREHSIAEPPTSTAGPHQRARRDRRDARMDAVGTGLALDIPNVLAGAQNPSATRGKPQQWKMAVVAGRNAQIHTNYDLKPFRSNERRYRVFVLA